MKSHDKLLPVMGILLGMGLLGTAVVLGVRHLVPFEIFGILFLPGYIIYLWGCAALAKAKGLSASTGIFLGMFLTALALFVLEDRTKWSNAQRAQREKGDHEAGQYEARRVAKSRPRTGPQKATLWFFGLIFLTLGLAIIVGYEIYWARVVIPERNGMTAAKSVSADKLDPQNDGKLVHVTGALSGVEKLSDPEFGVIVDALKLRRRVWMYQWEQGNVQSKSSYGVEDSKGNTTPLLKTRTYNYSQEWSEKVISSRSFYNVGHDNPDRKSIPDFAVAAKNISLGSFTITPELVEQLDNFQAAPVNATDLATLPKSLRTTAKLASEGIYFGADLANPAIGDLKVKIEFAPATNVSIIAQQNGNNLSPYAVAKSSSIAQLRIGTFSVQEMVGQFAKEEFQHRVLAWVFGGFAILMGGLFIMVARKREHS